MIVVRFFQFLQELFPTTGVHLGPDRPAITFHTGSYKDLIEYVVTVVEFNVEVPILLALQSLYVEKFDYDTGSDERSIILAHQVNEKLFLDLGERCVEETVRCSKSKNCEYG